MSGVNVLGVEDMTLKFKCKSLWEWKSLGVGSRSEKLVGRCRGRARWFAVLRVVCVWESWELGLGA